MCNVRCFDSSRITVSKNKNGTIKLEVYTRSGKTYVNMSSKKAKELSSKILEAVVKENVDEEVLYENSK